MKSLISFAGFGFSQLLLFFYTINVMVDTPKEYVTKKVILLLIACTWFLLFGIAIYKIYRIKNNQSDKNE